MKRLHLLTVVGLALSNYTLAQPTTQPGTPMVISRDAHSRTWQWEEDVTWPDGQVVRTPHRYIAIATGMHYSDEHGELQESRELIEAFPGGAIARYGQISAIFAPNLNTFGAIDFRLPDGQRLQSHVLGLAITDLASGRSALIAEIQDCVGEVLPPATVIYRNALSGNGIVADIIYQYTLAEIHQDVVLRSQLSGVSPADLQMDAGTCVLEIWTEAASPVNPRRLARAPVALLQSADNPAAAPIPLADEEIDFGLARMVAGSAFAIGNEAGTDEFADESLRVSKTWVVPPDTGRQFLVEAVPYLPLRDRLAARLPEAKATSATQRAAVHPTRRFPAAPLQARVESPAKPMQMATARTEPGFTIDYGLLIVDTNSFTFLGDTTYYVGGQVNMAGTTTIEGGTVIKSTNGTASSRLKLLGPVDCQTSATRPAVFTGKDDDSIGVRIAIYSSGNPTGNYYGRYVDLTANSYAVDLHDLKMRHAYYGFYLSANSDLTLSHAQLATNHAGIAYGSATRLRNVLIQDGMYAVGAGGLIEGEHLTFHRMSRLRSGTGYTTCLTNCLLISVTNYTNYTGAGNAIQADDSGVFQTVGGGDHYLATNSPYRDAGTTNISPDLLTALASLTTYPPLILDAAITADTVLSPQAGRDTSWPDIGYHYAPLDVFVCGLTVASNATVLATNGVAIGIDFSTNSWGFLLAPGKFISHGSPVDLNRVVRAHTVQERTGGNPGTRACFYDGNTPGGSASTLRARFTEFAQLAEDGYLLALGTKFDALEWTHSAVCNPALVIDTSGSGTLTVGATNTLWDRGAVLFGYSSTSTGKVVHCRNNLWRGVSLHFIAGNTNWTVADELFDRMYYLGDHSSPIVNYTNAWYLTNYGLSGGVGIIQLTNLTYEIGPLGRYYHPTNSPQIIDKGSRTADLAGLYHFTTTTNQVKEGTGTVDIGIHYVAVTNIAGVWVPIDSDGDGVPDYLEDANGNGSVDSGETDWESGSDDGLRVWITRPDGKGSIP